MSEKIGLVQETFSGIYHLDIEEINASQTFDYLFEDDEHFLIGQLDAYALCLSYVMGDAVFVGDMRFMPDYGTARCDFPRGSGATLYGSIQRLYQLSEQKRVFLCHDYLPEHRRHYGSETTIAMQKQDNIHVHTEVKREDFIAMR